MLAPFIEITFGVDCISVTLGQSRSILFLSLCQRVPFTGYVL